MRKYFEQSPEVLGIHNLIFIFRVSQRSILHFTYPKDLKVLPIFSTYVYLSARPIGTTQSVVFYVER